MEPATRWAVRLCVAGMLSVFFLTAAAGVAFAQGGTATATVVGKAQDNTGGVLPGVTITLTNVGTNQPRVVVTNEEGRYTMAGVPPGRYSLRAELTGFATSVHQEFTVNVGSIVTIDVTLSVSTCRKRSR